MSINHNVNILTPVIDHNVNISTPSISPSTDLAALDKVILSTEQNVKHLKAVYSALIAVSSDLGSLSDLHSSIDSDGLNSSATSLVFMQ